MAATSPPPVRKVGPGRPRLVVDEAKAARLRAMVDAGWWPKAAARELGLSETARERALGKPPRPSRIRPSKADHPQDGQEPASAISSPSGPVSGPLTA